MTTGTDYSKHTDEQLRNSIQRIKEQMGRIGHDSSNEALRSALAQRDAMQAELDRRGAAPEATP